MFGQLPFGSYRVSSASHGSSRQFEPSSPALELDADRTTIITAERVEDQQVLRRPRLGNFGFSLFRTLMVTGIVTARLVPAWTRRP
jgi:hypothetical protein